MDYSRSSAKGSRPMSMDFFTEMDDQPSTVVMDVDDVDPSRSLAKGSRPMPMDFFIEMDDQPSTVAMDVDNVDPLEIFGEGVISIDNKLADADFFNNFEDDFDDSDIN